MFVCWSFQGNHNHLMGQQIRPVAPNQQYSSMQPTQASSYAFTAICPICSVNYSNPEITHVSLFRTFPRATHPTVHIWGFSHTPLRPLESVLARTRASEEDILAKTQAWWILLGKCSRGRAAMSISRRLERTDTQCRTLKGQSQHN